MAITSLIFALAAIVMICLINHGMKQEALKNARLKARIILDHNLAIHTYFSRNLKPILFKHTDACMADGYFEPVWMSSTFAVREINKYFRSSATDEYYYKECAINARSPQNEADASEKTFIEKLNDDSDLTEHTEIKRIN